MNGYMILEDAVEKVDMIMAAPTTVVVLLEPCSLPSDSRAAASMFGETGDRALSRHDYSSCSHLAT